MSDSGIMGKKMMIAMGGESMEKMGEGWERDVRQMIVKCT